MEKLVQVLISNLTPYKVLNGFIGGCVGWLIGELRPAFPLAIVAIAFILYDAYTAWQLDKRVHVKYPERTKRHEAKFTSFEFSKVVKRTIPNRLIVILLAWMAERFVFIHIEIPVSYAVTGVILFEQAWSAMENNASCRDDNESRFWKMLQRIMVDKTSRHFDIDPPLDDYIIEDMRRKVMEWDKKKMREKGHKRKKQDDIEPIENDAL